MSYSIIDPDKLVDGQDLDPSVILANLQAIADAVNAIAPSPGIPDWGSAVTAHFSGDGSPVGVVTPDNISDLYLDNTTPGLWQANGLTDADWTQVTGGGSGIPTHAGDPTGVVTPSEVGELLIDTSTPALYQATGLTSADWEQVGAGGGGGLPTGWTQDASNPANVDAGNGGLSAEANGGTAVFGGNSIGISGNGEFSASRNGIIQMGSNGGATLRVVSSHGSTIALNAGGLPVTNLPTSDPGISGALWNNAGVPAISP